MKNIYLLGCSGSIGCQALEILSTMPDVKVRTMSFGKNINKAIELINQFHPEYVCSQSEEDSKRIKKLFPDIMVGFGEDGLVKAATLNPNEEGYLLNALVGMVGLKPTIEAIKINRHILLANKETLVVGGEVIKELLKHHSSKLIPIDSEHSAIMQCLEGRSKDEVEKIIITASGGAFRDKDRNELKDVTIDDALAHPNWSMGKKITVDCATMVNKGLEVMEAHYLFDMPYEKIECVMHLESIVHSMVKYKDGSIIAQMAKPDMRIPIQNALTYPTKQRFTLDETIELKDYFSLTFKELSFTRYPMLKLAYEVANAGGVLPLVFNSANEEAVRLFLDKKIKFLDIEKILTVSVNHFKVNNHKLDNLDDILEFDKVIRKYVNLEYLNIISREV